MGFRSRAAAALAAVALVVSGCGGSATHPATSDRSGSTAISTGTPDRTVYPGAAALSKRAVPLSRAAFVPTIAQAPDDVPTYWHRCHATRLRTSPLTCVLGDTSAHPRKVIALVGDSATGGWMAPLDVIGRRRHWKIITLLHTMCTWTATMTLTADTPVRPNVPCQEWGRNALHALISSIRPDVVISTDRPRVTTPTAATGTDAASTAVGRGLATYWKQLLAHHIPVVAIRETPEPGRNMPVCLKTRSVRSCSTPAAVAIARVTPVIVADRAVGHRDTLFDLNRYLCTSVCSPVVGNVLVYRDVHHLTRTFSLTLVPYLERDLLRVPALAG